MLYLEDEAAITLATEDRLIAAGFMLACARAEAWLQDHRPDAAVLDIELEDGLNTRVAALLVEAEIPCVVFSGRQQSRIAGTVFAGGVWLGKPVDQDALVACVRGLAGRAGKGST